MSLTATTDNKVFVKVQAKEEILKLAQPAPATPATGSQETGGRARPPGRGPTARSLAARADPNAVDPRMQQRYRRRSFSTPRRLRRPIVIVPPPTQPPSVILKLIFSGEGTWQKERDDKYKITVKDEKEQLLEGVIREGYFDFGQGGPQTDLGKGVVLVRSLGENRQRSWKR